MDAILKDKVILVSTGTKGVGAALVKECALSGANVIFSGRDEGAAILLQEELGGLGVGATFIKTDLRLVDEIVSLFERIEESYGYLDGFVSYAGITPISSLVDTDQKLFDDVMAVNVRAPFFSSQRAIRLMLRAGGGSLVLIGSAHSWGGQKDRAAYAVSKGALYTLSEHVSHNYSNEHIRCNFLTMGWTPTEGELALREDLGMAGEELVDYASRLIPMGRMCTPSDIVPAALYLLSDFSSMVTGSNIRCTGGEYI